MLDKLQARGINNIDDDIFKSAESKINIDDLINIRKYYNDILRSKDFINVSIDSISKNMPKEDKEASKMLKN